MNLDLIRNPMHANLIPDRKSALGMWDIAVSCPQEDQNCPWLSRLSLNVCVYLSVCGWIVCMHSIPILCLPSDLRVNEISSLNLSTDLNSI
jgi:hypothetical protein